MNPHAPDFPIDPPAAAAVPAPPVLSVLILAWNNADLLRKCLTALARDEFSRSREIVVVDNASPDDAGAMVAREFPHVRLLRHEENHGYAKGNNLGAAAARGEWLCLLGSDTEVEPGALEALVSFLEENPGYGAAAPRLIGEDGQTQRACMRFPGLWTAWSFDNWFGTFPPGRQVQDHYYHRDFDHLTSRDVDQPPGTCFVVSRRRYQAMGGLDQQLFLFFNDVDFCRRLILSGARIHYLATVAVGHLGGASTGIYDRMIRQWQQDRLAYYRKWYGDWVGPLLKLCILERGFEEWLNIRRRLPGKEDRRAATRELWQVLKEVLGS